MNGSSRNGGCAKGQHLPGCEDAEMVVRFGDNWEIVVPARIDLLTPYVLLEQECWFEREMGFVNAWLKPGMRVIDVGANYGVYTVSIASQIGPAGAVWAFEPCRDTFQTLTRSVAHNRFNNVVVIKAALGADFANVRLAVGENSELNQITHDEAGPTESVDMTTLDHCDGVLGFGDVDFIKLDAEGYEVQVVCGAERLLRKSSPLIMFEFKHNDALNLDLLEKLQSLSYSIYVLVPGINALVPYCESQHNDALLINLFACKRDRAQVLQRQGYLIESPANTESAPDVRALLSRGDGLDVSANATAFRQPGCSDIDAGYIRAARLARAAENTDLAPADRWRAVSAAFAICSHSAQDSLWLQALKARLSLFIGNRADAAKFAAAILPSIGLSREAPPPAVLPACDRYDSLDSALNRRNWFAASVHECFEHSRAFSSYMLGTACLANLQAIDNLGYLPVDLERRRQLILRNSSHSTIHDVPGALLRDHPDNLNYRFWRQQKSEDQTRALMIPAEGIIASPRVNP